MPPRRQRPQAALARALRSKSVLVVCGSGGVGKTTTAAALALRAARDGRRVLVCTVDPSRRLATSLGRGRLSGRPRSIDTGGDGPGALWAMVLDVKSTFDDLVARYAPDDAARRRILDNRFYRHVSAALAGSHEYMAMEKLLELAAEPRWDLVVLDTPPTRHALDFLEAPDRLLGFLDTDVLRWFLRPYFAAGKLTLKVATRTGALALKAADRLLGLDFLQDLSEFFLAFGTMYDGFKERATRVQALLRETSSGFLLVAAPSPLAIEEALYFHRRLTEKGMPFLAFIVNRVHPDPGRDGGGGPAAVEPALAARLVETFREQQALARVDRRAVARLEVDARQKPIVIPEFDQDIHDIKGLTVYARTLLPETRAAAPTTRVGPR